MIRAAALPEFEVQAVPDSPLPDAAIEAIAALLLDAVDAEEAGGSEEPEQEPAG